MRTKLLISIFQGFLKKKPNLIQYSPSPLANFASFTQLFSPPLGARLQDSSTARVALTAVRPASVSRVRAAMPPTAAETLRAWLLSALVVHSAVAGNPDAKRLYDDLLSNYNKLVRPVVNTSDVLRVCIKLKLSQLIDVVRWGRMFRLFAKICGSWMSCYVMVLIVIYFVKIKSGLGKSCRFDVLRS